MRLLTPMNKGCNSGNASTVPSSYGTKRVPTVYCETLIPTRRQCVVYSFGVDNIWDFDNALLKRGCRVLSFDPFCCGAAHKMGPNHDFIPIGLAPYDGLIEAPPPTSDASDGIQRGARGQRSPAQFSAAHRTPLAVR